jgi:hypothetical protein
MMALQNNTSLKKVLGSLYDEMYPASHDGDHAMNMKPEEVSDTDEEEVCVPIKIRKIKAETKVSCMSLLGR